MTHLCSYVPLCNGPEYKWFRYVSPVINSSFVKLTKYSVCWEWDTVVQIQFCNDCTFLVLDNCPITWTFIQGCLQILICNNDPLCQYNWSAFAICSHNAWDHSTWHINFAVFVTDSTAIQAPNTGLLWDSPSCCMLLGKFSQRPYWHILLIGIQCNSEKLIFNGNLITSEYKVIFQVVFVVVSPPACIVWQPKQKVKFVDSLASWFGRKKSVQSYTFKKEHC